MNAKSDSIDALDFGSSQLAIWFAKRLTVVEITAPTALLAGDGTKLGLLEPEHKLGRSGDIDGVRRFNSDHLGYVV